jgi:hypothetical protein
MAVQPNPPPAKAPIAPASGLYREGVRELRLDVKDGKEPFPQMVASGNFGPQPGFRTHWVAKLREGEQQYEHNYWTGEIEFRLHQVSDFPYTKVAIWLSDRQGQNHQAHIQFIGGPPHDVITLPHESDSYRRIKFIFAASEGKKAITTMNPGDYPRDKKAESVLRGMSDLSISTVFKDAGFEVTETTLRETVKPQGAGPDRRWSNKELHDAMQAYWENARDEDEKQRHKIWVFFTTSYLKGGRGVMFDRKGPPFRQGCAIFIDEKPKEDDDLNDHRRLFITACHEIGHCLNLGHSDVPLRVPELERWLDTSPERKALSFMRDRPSMDEEEDLPKFDYRFSGYDQTPTGRELAFLRHAPEDFVYPSNRRDWYVESGSGASQNSQKSGLTLKLRASRKGEEPVFEFMEPVTLELKLTNTGSKERKKVDRSLLRSPSQTMSVIITRDDQTVQFFRPYARHCMKPDITKIAVGESIYESLFVSAGINRGNGKNGWFIDKPGRYTIKVVLHGKGQDLHSNPLTVCVAPPQGSDKQQKLQERRAQDLFTEEAGRVIAFRGSRVLKTGLDTLKTISEELSDRKVALHASWVLGKSIVYEDKKLTVVLDGNQTRLQVDHDSADPLAGQFLARALTDQDKGAIQSFGHIDYGQCAEFYGKWLYGNGHKDEGAIVQNTLCEDLSKRKIKGRPIAPVVLYKIKELADFYNTKKDLDKFDEWKKEKGEKRPP